MSVQQNSRRSGRIKPEHFVNEAIPFSHVFVLDQNGEKLGVLPKKIAIEKAKSLGCDLVIISDNAQQPVAKILDYGKFKYNRKKKTKESKAKQTLVENKEVRLTPMIGDHDLMVKSRKAREFLMAGDRVKVSLKFRGREISRQDLGFNKLNQFYDSLKDIAKIEKEPALFGGRFLDMYLSRDKTKGGGEQKKVLDDKKNDHDVSTHEANDVKNIKLEQKTEDSNAQNEDKKSPN